MGALGWLHPALEGTTWLHHINTAAITQQGVQKYGKAFAIIIQSLSHVVQQSLSSAARSITSSNPQVLWDEVRGQYSASVGPRPAAVLHDIWASPISEETIQPRICPHSISPCSDQRGRR